MTFANMLCVLSITEVGKINFTFFKLVLCHMELCVFSNLQVVLLQQGLLY